jgi:23S rRNA pseudouridine1911/1915/1917 synthase
MTKLNVVFEDQYLVVIDKPAGLVVTPSETQKEPTLAEIASEQFNITVERGGVVHRLDKDTSGLIILAKSEEMFHTLQQQFKDRTVKKEYLALVHGTVREGGVVDLPIARNPGDREKFTVFDSDENAREAITKYRPEQYFEMSEETFGVIFENIQKQELRKLKSSRYSEFTLVRCFPLTGRTHQIRVHLKYANFPIVGDTKYGGRKTARLDFLWVPRQFLHAAKLQFVHPVSGDQIILESPLPEDLREVLSNLKIKS